MRVILKHDITTANNGLESLRKGEYVATKADNLPYEDHYWIQGKINARLVHINDIEILPDDIDKANEIRGSYEVLWHKEDKPVEFCAYATYERPMVNKISPKYGIGTWIGDNLGRITRVVHGHKFDMIYATDINGLRVYGRSYYGSGGIVRFKAFKNQG